MAPSSFPATKLPAVLANVQKLRDEEAHRQGALHNATTAKQVRAIMAGHTYTKSAKAASDR